jgi:hypothetical protein
MKGYSDCGGKTTRIVDHGMGKSEWSYSLSGQFIRYEKTVDVYNPRLALSMDKVVKSFLASFGKRIPDWCCGIHTKW